MSNITYDRNKVEAFKSAFANYQTAKTSFKAKMEQFREVIDFMEGTIIPPPATHQESITGVEGYVINEKGILLQTPNTNVYDSSVNSVINIGSGSAFVTDVEYQAGNVASVTETNKLYQVGLDDLNYESTENNVQKYYNIDIDPEITNSGDCNMDNLFQCSARAKMKNKPYYGIEGGTDSNGASICDCYIFDEIPDNEVTDRLRTVEFNAIQTAYLATLMDGSLYQIKEDSFSDNYDGFYGIIVSDSKIHALIDGSEAANLNPFVGDGINTIKITELGRGSCG